MNNLLQKNITYLGLKEAFNGDERKVIDTIQEIKNISLKSKLEDEAKIYWAKKLKTAPANIFYGDIDENNPILYLWNGCFLKKYIIGDAKFAYSYNLVELKGVFGRLVCPYISYLPNLEFVTEGIEMGQPTNQLKQRKAYLPKLKKCQYLDLSGLSIQSLGLEKTEFINLARTDIKDFHIKKAKEIILDDSNIKDISSLEKVDFLSLYSVDCKKLKINPKLAIHKEIAFATINDQIISKYLEKNKIEKQKEV